MTSAIEGIYEGGYLLFAFLFLISSCSSFVVNLGALVDIFVDGKNLNLHKLLGEMDGLGFN